MDSRNGVEARVREKGTRTEIRGESGLHSFFLWSGQSQAVVRVLSWEWMGVYILADAVGWDRRCVIVVTKFVAGFFHCSSRRRRCC